MAATTISNRYRLERELGAGGMGKVYRAYDRLTGQDVALKRVTTPSQQLDIISRAPTGTSHDRILANEFRLLASLRHPNIISVLDYGFDQQQPYYTMTLLDNAGTIYEAADTNRPSQISLLLQMLQALQYLHRRGILHRDLKPGNVLVLDNQVYLLDFGLALESSFAKTHDAAGTLPYMPPEVISGRAVSPATDLYSFGVMAYEILLGQHPFNTKSYATLLEEILMQPPTVPVGVLDRVLENFLLRLLSKDPEDRYQSAWETIQALCRATDYPMPQETEAIRDSFIMAAQFVGREKELQTLHKAMDSMLDNKGSAWLIGGESGVGKSRLLDEMRIAALVKGALVVRGQARSASGLSYQLWRDILPHIVLHLTLEDDEIAILRQLVPNIEQLVGRLLPDDFSLSDTVLRNRLSLVVVDVILRVAEKYPLVFILEDLQWAAESLDILKQLLPLANQYRLLLLGNYRSDETPHLADDLAGMKHITLRRMDDSEIRKLSASMLGEAGQNNDVVELLERETEGNTFFIVEVVRALAEEAGQLANIGRVTIPAQIFAGGIQRVVERRLSRLPDWTRHTVEIAAIAGRQIDRKVIAYIAPDINVDEWLRVCSDAAVFTVDGEHWSFAHDKLREHLLDNVLDSQKKQYHALVGAALETCYAASLQDYAEVLTKHFAIAGIPDKEGKYAALACESVLNFSTRDALKYALRAIELHAHLQADNPQAELARLHYIAGCAYVRLSQYDNAIQHLETSLREAEAVNHRLGIAQANNVLGEIGIMTGKQAESIPKVETSLTIFRELNDLNHIYYALTNLAILNSQLGYAELANQLIVEAVDVVSNANNPIALAQAYNNLAITYDRKGDFDTAIEIHERALAIRRHYKDRPGAASSMVNLGAIKADIGNFDEATSLMSEGAQIYGIVGNRRNVARTYEMLATVYRKFEKYDEALHYYQEGLAIAEEIGEKFVTLMTLISLGDLYLAIPNIAAAHAVALKSLKAAQELNLLPNKVHAIFLYARAAWEQKQVLKALRYFGLISNHREAIGKAEQLDEVINSVREILPEVVFTSTLDAGKNLALDEAITEILNQEGKLND
jgi:predicted ATPase